MSHSARVLLLLDHRYTESPVCKMTEAVFASPSLLSYSLVCSWTAVGHTFLLAVCRSGRLCSVCSLASLIYSPLLRRVGLSRVGLGQKGNRLSPIKCSTSRVYRLFTRHIVMASNDNDNQVIMIILTYVCYALSDTLQVYRYLLI